ncbi:ribose-phosphate diphosphokinase [Candidatus Dependentiae bacterium]|nr:ribose-phosphate diphosphokinase [Candidatus Dependentiae bacterium]
MPLLPICIALDDQYAFAADLAQQLRYPFYVPVITRFADGELEIHVEQGLLLQQRHVVLIAPTAHCVHDELIKIFFLSHLVKQRGAAKCTWIIPYCGYARQCQDSSGNVGHMAAVARMAEASGIDEIIVTEPHDHTLSSLFSIPVHMMSMHKDIVQAIRDQNITLNEACIVAPDQGAIARARLVAQALNAPLVNMVKERFDTDQSRVLGIHGYTGFKRAIVVDDILDTGRTALTVAQALFDLGVEEMHGIFVHGIFSRGIQEIVSTSWYRTICCSPTVPLPELALHDTLSVFSIPYTMAALVRIIQNPT